MSDIFNPNQLNFVHKTQLLHYKLHNELLFVASPPCKIATRCFNTLLCLYCYYGPNYGTVLLFLLLSLYCQ